MQANDSVSVGDDVVITIEDMAVVKQMQINHGEWIDEMEECLVGPCKVIRLTGVNAVVKAPSGSTYQLNVELLSKYNNFCESMLCTGVENTDKQSSSSSIYVGSRVTLTSSASWMRSLQSGHGGWSKLMQLLVGKEVEVMKVFVNGDLYVTWSGTYWCINPLCIGEPKPELFQKGNRVLISSDIEATEEMQDSHGGYHEAMKIFAGKTGIVKCVFPTDDVLVKIGEISICYNPLVLKKISDEESVPTYSIGDIVKVIDDKTRMKVLQEGHGEWHELMTLILKKKGMVKLIHPNGDLQVEIKDTEIRLNPQCVVEAESFLSEMKKMISTDLDDETMSNIGDTPLHGAVRNKNIDLCCQLIEEGADVNVQNEKGMTPIMLAAKIGCGEVLSRLVQHPDARLDIGDQNNDTALHLAVDNSNDDAVRILLEKGANIKAINNQQFTPFHLAAKRGYEKILELCLDRFGGSLVDLQKDDKFTALHLAAMNNHTACLLLLIGRMADLNIRNNTMQTALHIAVSQKYMDCVKILVESEAEVNLRDEVGDTPLHDAIHQHNIHKSMFGLAGIFQLMGGLEAGTDKSKDIATYLVEHGASLDILNSVQKTPLTACEDQSLREKLHSMQAEIGTGRETPLLVAECQVMDYELIIQNLQNEVLCVICKENRNNIAFNCGHRACDVCANNVNDCHMCRRRIETRTRTY